MKQKAVTIVQLVLFYGLLLWFGAPEIRTQPNLYALFVLGVIAILYQPAFSSFEAGPSEDRGTARQILWTIQAIQGLAHVEAVFWRYPQSFEWTTFAWIGLGCAATGLALRTWAVVHLGAAFTWHIATDRAATLITSGPFSLVRHPSYVGAFLLYAGSVVFLQAWFTLLPALLLMPMAFARRIRWEEEALTNRFGASYETYKGRVGGWFPRVRG